MNLRKLFSSRNTAQPESDAGVGVYLEAYRSGPIKSSNNKTTTNQNVDTNTNANPPDTEEPIDELDDVAEEETATNQGTDPNSHNDTTQEANNNYNNKSVASTTTTNGSSTNADVNINDKSSGINSLNGKQSTPEPTTDHESNASAEAKKKRIEDYNNRRRTITQMKEELEKKQKEKENGFKITNDGTSASVKEEKLLQNGNNQEWYNYVKEQQKQMKEKAPFWNVVEMDVPVVPTNAAGKEQTEKEKDENGSLERLLLVQLIRWIDTFGIPPLEQAEQIPVLKQQLLQSNEDANQLEKECVDMAEQLESKDNEIVECKNDYQKKIAAMKEEKLQTEKKMLGIKK